MNKILTFLILMTLISAMTFCCCAAHLALAAQKQSCCTQSASENSKDPCHIQNHPSSSGHSCECQTIAGILSAADPKIAHASSVTGSFTDDLSTSMNLTKVWAHHMLLSSASFHSPPGFFISSSTHSINPILRI